MNWVTPLLQKEISSSDSVIDLGCGILLATDTLVCKSFLGVDICADYISKISDKFEVMNLDLSDVKSYHIFKDKSYDVVLAIDFIEHLVKPSGFLLLDLMERVARRKVIVFTPDGFVKQDEGEGWAQGHPEFQTHKSGWITQDFVIRGYRTSVLPDCDCSHILAVKEIV